MKRRFTTLLAAVALLVGCVASFSSCTDDDGWYPYPPSGWNSTYYDNYLTGAWRLVQVNSRPVTGYDVNYLEFYGNGRGRYYYYQNGQLYRERMAYWCEDFYGSGFNPELNLQYQSGQSSTMSYWFTDNGNSLWMQWNTSQGTVTYLYRYTNTIP